MSQHIKRSFTVALAAIAMVVTVALPAMATPPDDGCFRIEDGADGAIGNVAWTFNGDESVTVTGPVTSVKVKGGPDFDGVLYTEAPFTDLTAPINPNNGTPYGISHVDICPGDEGRMCIDIAVQPAGHITTASARGGTVTIEWADDGFSWAWTGVEGDRTKIAVATGSGERIVLRGISGTYVGEMLSLTACHCPR